MLQPQDILEAAKEQAAARAREPRWRAGFAGATPRPPVFVKNLTRPGRDYFLVDFQKHGVSSARMIIDPATGNARQTTAVEKDGEALPLFILPDEVTVPTVGEIILENGQRVNVPAGSFRKEVIWQHSQESRTMFQPLYRLTWSNLTLYLRVDRRFYGELTPTEDTSPPPGQP